MRLATMGPAGVNAAREDPVIIRRAECGSQLGGVDELNPWSEPDMLASFSLKIEPRLSILKTFHRYSLYVEPTEALWHPRPPVSKELFNLAERVLRYR